MPVKIDRGGPVHLNPPQPTIELNKIAILNRLLMEANTTIDALVTAINATEKDGDDIIKVTLNLLQRDWQKKADELAGILDMPKFLPDFFSAQMKATHLTPEELDRLTRVTLTDND